MHVLLFLGKNPVPVIVLTTLIYIGESPIGNLSEMEELWVV
jgi:hypothetical protein